MCGNHDQHNNSSFSDKMESVLYNTELPITGTITRNSKLYQKLGLESSRNRRWLSIMSCLYNIIST